MKIMIAEDEPVSLALLEAKLGEWGHEVASCQDGAAVLARVKTFRPDLAILDVMMPEMNGYQVCRALREDPATQKLPVIMLTAKSQQADRFWGEQVGADAYLTKPVDLDKLRECVSKFQAPK